MEGHWLPDPTGRHEARFWDSTGQWTVWVTDGGQQSEDPLGWPEPPADSGVGLRSAGLQYMRHGPGPWPVLDMAGDQVGYLMRSSFSLTGRSIGLWDIANVPWMTVKQSIHGTGILVAEREVGRIEWHGVGSLSTVDISVHLAGRMRGRMRATRADLASGKAVVTDPGGSPLLALGIARDGDTRVLRLRRLVGLPDDYEYAVQSVVPAIILELDNRSSFQALNDDDITFSDRSPWPG